MVDCEVTESRLQEAIRIEVSKWIEPHQVSERPDAVSDIEVENNLDVPDIVVSPSSINNGWCRVFAERVQDRLDNPECVTVKSDANRHTWLEHNGLCYDADCWSGVPHPSLLPVYANTPQQSKI